MRENIASCWREQDRDSGASRGSFVLEQTLLWNDDNCMAPLAVVVGGGAVWWGWALFRSHREGTSVDHCGEKKMRLFDQCLL